MITTKKFEGYLILDWNRKGMRIIKKKLSKSRLKPSEICIKLDIEVIVPDRKEIVARGKIELSQAKVDEMIISELEGE